MSAIGILTPPRVEPRTEPSRMFLKDDMLCETEQRSVNNFLQWDPGWKFGWKSKEKEDLFAFWSRHFAGSVHWDAKPYDCIPELDKFPVIRDFWHRLTVLIPGHQLIRSYANGQTYGSDGTVHVDAPENQPHSWTCVYYPHWRWNVDWGGDTVFFNQEKTDIIRAVYPKPNRLLMFESSIPHVARGVSRTCPVLRTTLVFRTIKR